jgi:transposase
MEKELKFDVRKLSPKEQEELRKKIVRKMKKHGDTKEVANICECSQRHVQSTWKKYLDGGVLAVKAAQMGRPQNSGKLTKEQQAEIRKNLIDKDPSQLKLPGYLWDRQRVRDLIYLLSKIKISVRSTGNYLKKWGMTPQRPIKRNYKQSPEEVKQWLEEDYPEIKQRAKDENAEINWGDETGCYNESNYIKGYAPIGKTPVLPVGNEKIKVNMISSITNQGKLRYMFYSESMNGKMLIKFMQRLIKDSERKIFFIIDNLKAHHAKIVTEWLKEHKDEIEVFFLPSYCPEYNPDEYLNGNLKRKLADKGYSKDVKEIESKARGIMKTFQNDTDHVASFFQAKNSKYASL